MRKYYYRENAGPLEWDGNVSNPYNHWIEERMSKVHIDRERHFVVLKIYLITPNRRFFLDKCNPTSHAYIDVIEREFPDCIPVVFVHHNLVTNLRGDGVELSKLW